jgi:hypothetical protein
MSILDGSFEIFFDVFTAESYRFSFLKVCEVLNNLVEANHSVQKKPSVAGLLPVKMFSNFRIA